MEKVKLVYIKDEGLLTPKGKVVGIHPISHVFSDYELSNQSLFEIVEVDQLDISPGESDDVLFFEHKKIKHKKIKDIKKPKKHKIKKHPHPPLKTGSLIWDYGPGRTYSTPQLAFEALKNFWALSLIDSNQYVRGYGGTYIGSLSFPIIEISDVYTNGPNGSRLFIDSEDGYETIFQMNDPGLESSDAAIQGPHVDSGSVRCEDVVIEKMTFKCCNRSGAISVNFRPNGSVNGYQSVRDWVIRDCIFEPAPSASPENCLYIQTHGAIKFTVERCKMTGLQYGVGCSHIYPQIECDIPQFLIISSSIIDAFQETVILNNSLGSMIGVLNSTLIGSIVQWDSNIGGAIVINSIIKGIPYYLPNNSYDKFLSVANIGNIYELTSTNFGRDKNGTFTFDQWQDRYFEAEKYSKLADAKLGLSPDFIPDITSPAWGYGQAVSYADLLGRVIGQGFLDSGPYQETLVKKYPSYACGYCLIDEVISSTGVLKENLDQATDDQLAILLCQWIGEVSNLIDKYCETSWEIESQPEGVRRAAITMMSKVIAVAVQRRKSPFITINNFSVKMVADDLLSDDVKALLDEYREPALSVDYNGDFGLGIFSATGEDDKD